MKPKLRSGMLCSCLLFLIQASRSDAQQQPPASQPAPTRIQARDTIGDGFSIEPLFWWTRNSPALRLGQASKLNSVDASGNVTYAQGFPGDLDSLGKSKYGVGAMVTFPTRSENSIQVSYFRVQGDGSPVAGQDTVLFGNPFPQGDVLSTSYKLQDFKLSWNYLTYPHPSNGAKFRIKTLWEVQYVKFNALVDAPLDANVTPTSGNKSIIYPTLGLGIEYHAGKHFVLEAKASGFGLYHRASIWDAEGAMVFRSGRLEGFLGGKAFHFKTSPRGDQYFSENLWGPYLGVRWVLR